MLIFLVTVEVLGLVTGEGHNRDIPDPPPSQCIPPVGPGPCRADITVWAYDSNTQSCQSYSWGGCSHDDVNHIYTKEQCIKQCSPEVCKKPPQTGQCRGMFEQWFYNSSESQCNTFIYGGCGGNDNNFDSQEKCMAACHQNTDESGEKECDRVGEKERVVLGEKAVVTDSRWSDWYLFSCEEECDEQCFRADHAWCQAYSVRHRLAKLGCQCYLFDHHISAQMFKDDTEGISINIIRPCLD